MYDMYGFLLLSLVRGQSVSNLVLSRYIDARCQTLDTGEGVQQSWYMAPLQNSFCFDVNVGLSCSFRCFLKLTCEFSSGSGVMIEDYSQTNCEGAMGDRVPLARHLTWLQVEDFFKGQCAPTGDGKYMAFNKPIDRYPDCSAQGAVDVGEGSDVAYEARYSMQFYTDNACQNLHPVTNTSTFQYNKFQWRVYRGTQHCLDYIDKTDRGPSFTSVVINQDMMNLKLFCGNIDGLGNGIMLERHSGAACTGSTSDAMYWRDGFAPMNLYILQDFFNGECVVWGNMFVKFDERWDSLHYPDCSQYACKSGYCSGGRLQEPYTGATAYMGEIGTPMTQAQMIPGGAPAFGLSVSLIFLRAAAL